MKPSEIRVSGDLSEEMVDYLLGKLSAHYGRCNRFWRRRVWEALWVEGFRRIDGRPACKAHLKHLEFCFYDIRFTYDIPELLVACGSGCLMRAAQLVDYNLPLLSLKQGVRISLKGDLRADGGLSNQ